MFYAGFEETHFHFSAAGGHPHSSHAFRGCKCLPSPGAEVLWQWHCPTSEVFYVAFTDPRRSMVNFFSQLHALCFAFVDACTDGGCPFFCSPVFALCPCYLTGEQYNPRHWGLWCTVMAFLPDSWFTALYAAIFTIYLCTTCYIVLSSMDAFSALYAAILTIYLYTTCYIVLFYGCIFDFFGNSVVILILFCDTCLRPILCSHSDLLPCYLVSFALWLSHLL